MTQGARESLRAPSLTDGSVAHPYEDSRLSFLGQCLVRAPISVLSFRILEGTAHHRSPTIPSQVLAAWLQTLACLGLVHKSPAAKTSSPTLSTEP